MKHLTFSQKALRGLLVVEILLCLVPYVAVVAFPAIIITVAIILFLDNKINKERKVDEKTDKNKIENKKSNRKYVLKVVLICILIALFLEISNF